YLNLSIPLFDTISNFEQQSLAYANMAEIYAINAEFGLALSTLEKAMALTSYYKMTEHKIELYSDAGYVYYKVGDYNKSIFFYEKALDLADGGFMLYRVEAINGLRLNMKKMKNFEKALYYAESWHALQ